MRRFLLLLAMVPFAVAAANDEPVRLCGPALDAAQIETLARDASVLAVAREIARNMLGTERFSEALRELVAVAQWVEAPENAPFWQRLRDLYRQARVQAVSTPQLRIAYDDLFSTALTALPNVPVLDVHRLVAPHLPLLRPAERLLPRRREVSFDLLAETYVEFIDEKALRARLRLHARMRGIGALPREPVRDVARKLAWKDRKPVQSAIDDMVATLGNDPVDSLEFEALVTSRFAAMPSVPFLQLPHVSAGLARTLWDYEPIPAEDEDELRASVLEGLHLQVATLVREYRNGVLVPPRHRRHDRRRSGANPVIGRPPKPGTRAERIAEYRPRIVAPAAPPQEQAPVPLPPPVAGAETPTVPLEEILASVALDETVLEEFLDASKLLRPEERLTLQRALTRLQAGESLFSLYPLVRRVRRHRFWVIRLNGGTSNYRMVLQLTRQRVYGLLLADVKSNRNATERALDEAKRRWNSHLGR